MTTTEAKPAARPAVVAGQQLWFVPRDRRDDVRPIVITKVGRDWLWFGVDSRIRRDTLASENTDGVRGRAYLTREDWDAAQEAETEWWNVHKMTDIFHRRPAHLSAATIRQAIALLAAPEKE